MWGLLKDRVNQSNPKTIAELKLAIIQNNCTTKREECARVVDNFACRLQNVWHGMVDIWSMYWNKP